MIRARRTERQPEALRQRLLDATAGIAAAQGLHAVTIQSVSHAAGVTKGGLFHHFANKDELIQAVIRQQLRQMDVVVDEALARDGGYGCFTRAYVLAVFALSAATAPVSLALMAEPSLRDAWTGWITDRLSRHAATDGATALTAVRLAADGLWLWDLWQDGSATQNRDALRRHLLDATRKETC